jgi:hypothetical protein
MSFILFPSSSTLECVDDPARKEKEVRKKYVDQKIQKWKIPNRAYAKVKPKIFS